MVSYKITLAGRTLDKLPLTPKEATEMSNTGFRFSIFNPAGQEFQLSRPYRLLHDIAHDVVTVEQT